MERLTQFLWELFLAVIVVCIAVPFFAFAFYVWATGAMYRSPERDL